ncbi:MAG: GntR family transcriptional regulator [Baekduia sp.]
MQQTSRPDQVFDRLVAAILDGRYAPGDRLPSQRALAAEFGVNMASLRAAVDRLAQLRLVEVRHGEPMRVADWRRAGGVELLARAAGTEPALLVAMFEARAILLREAARLAASRATGEQRDELARLAAAFGDAGTREARQQIDLAFMAALIDAAGNLVFTLILNSIRESYLAQADTYAGLVASAADLAPAYRGVAAAVGAADGDAAASGIDELCALQVRGMLEGGGA